MARTETVILTNMCMIYNGDKVLVQNKIDDDYSGITFPGGHVEKGEAFTDAVIREVLEETNLTILYPQLCGIKDWTNDNGIRYIVLFYKTDKYSGSLKSSEEGDVYWVNKDELPNMQLADGMKEMLKIFFEDEISEYYFIKADGEWQGVLK